MMIIKHCQTVRRITTSNAFIWFQFGWCCVRDVVCVQHVTLAFLIGPRCELALRTLEAKSYWCVDAMHDTHVLQKPLPTIEALLAPATLVQVKFRVVSLEHVTAVLLLTLRCERTLCALEARRCSRVDAMNATHVLLQTLLTIKAALAPATLVQVKFRVVSLEHVTPVLLLTLCCERTLCTLEARRCSRVDAMNATHVLLQTLRTIKATLAPATLVRRRRHRSAGHSDYTVLLASMLFDILFANRRKVTRCTAISLLTAAVALF